MHKLYFFFKFILENLLTKCFKFQFEGEELTMLNAKEWKWANLLRGYLSEKKVKKIHW